MSAQGAAPRTGIRGQRLIDGDARSVPDLSLADLEPLSLPELDSLAALLREAELSSLRERVRRLELQLLEEPRGHA